MPKITSRDNSKIKFARAVRDGRERRFVFIEGVRLAEEVLKSKLPVADIFFTADFAASERGNDFIRQTRHYSQNEVSEKIFESLADTKTSQGLILICEKPPTGKNFIEEGLKKNISNSALVVLLHRINNPSNLGAILRTAEAADVSGIILTKNSADVFSTKAIRSAMGASLRLPIWTNADFAEALNWAREENFKTVCADVNAEKIYTEINWKIPRLLVLGSEAHGLAAAERAEIEEGLLIPMANNVESLNLAVACGIIFYQWKMNNGKLQESD